MEIDQKIFTLLAIIGISKLLSIILHDFFNQDAFDFSHRFFVMSPKYKHGFIIFEELSTPFKTRDDSWVRSVPQQLQ